jgi:hypothetical protein
MANRHALGQEARPACDGGFVRSASYIGRSNTMSYGNSPEREQIIQRALTARTPSEIEAAGQALRQWIQEHPDDLNAEDALEPLAMLRRGIAADAEKETPVRIAS